MNAAIHGPLNLSSCDVEPIHIPGSIQPHGMMLVLASDGRRIIQAAGDVEGRLGCSDWQTEDISTLIGQMFGATVAALLQPSVTGGFIGQLQTLRGETLDISAHLSEASIIVELETASPAGVLGTLLLDQLANAASGFERSASLDTLCDRAAIEFRRLTGFDRVMIYRFLDDGVGCVMAEDRREGTHSFLNHHFPASDIPRQARALYLRNLIRVIPDATYQPVPLRPAISSVHPLDMSDCALRSVSPIHLEYLQNMGVRASASVSIVKDGLLWGLIACHHETPRTITYEVRAACRSLAGSLARQIKSKEEAEGYRQRIRLLSFEDDIVALVSREGTLGDALANHLEELNRMMGADGVAVIRAGEIVTFGVTPGKKEIFDIAEWHVRQNSEAVFWTESLSNLYPAGASFPELGSGVLIVTVSEDDPWILVWFRVEQIEAVKWAGNPHKSDATVAATLSPRASFEAWSQTVRGRAHRWTLGEVDAAARLRIGLLEVQQNRRMRDLNRQLTATLQDKDLLLQQKEYLIGEVNHRVQNSLQLVSSFLSLQAKASGSAELQGALGEARRRLSAVALVHRRLYRGDNIGVVDLARYIEELCADTFSFKGQDWSQHLTLNLAPVLVSTDRAVTLGLILTELMINCSKHAYAGADGPIELELIEDRAHLQLTVCDKGSGKNAKGKAGFGSRMMDGLVSQLRGTLTYTDNNPGLRTTLRLPIEAAARSVH